MANLAVDFLGMKMKNPTVLASGIMDFSASSMKYAVDSGAGAVVTKSISLEERKGHKSPIIITEKAFVMNAVGLSNPGVDAAVEDIKDLKKKVDAPVIASIFGKVKKEYGEMARRISEARPDMIEVNISCPNVEDEFGKPFSLECESAADVTRIVKENTKIPISVKLSPNVPSIGKIAKAVEDAGADAITAINTVGPGMAIDIESGKPILKNKAGGVSGPAIRPLAVKAVYDIYESVSIPIMGVGGITTGNDAIEMIMAGASAVQIGSAVYYRGIDVFSKVCDEAREFMDKQGYSKIKDMAGIAHE
ncbi:dihydroorotate dehydrogenase [Candidatus Woesearchaeota archaeon]|nr:dihydroorotate dehydrogenase [Candidatus Woesearchaeota archaeon]